MDMQERPQAWSGRVRASAKVRDLLLHESGVGLMNDGCRLERMSMVFLAHVASREPSQLRVEERHKCIERVLIAHARCLAHAFADDFAAAEFAFVAVDGEILFDFEDERSVAEADFVAGGRAEHIGVVTAFHFMGHTIYFCHRDTEGTENGVLTMCRCGALLFVGEIFRFHFF